MARHKSKSHLRLQSRTRGYDAPDLRGSGYGSIQSFQQGRKRPGSLNAHKGTFARGRRG
jgi:hypothetical protein